MNNNQLKVQNTLQPEGLKVVNEMNKIAGVDTAKEYKESAVAKTDASATDAAAYVAKTAATANANFVNNDYSVKQQNDKGGYSQGSGYSLDAKNQLNYMKQAIQADVYSQREIQQTGYISSLKQAIANAELEADALALENYNMANQIAIQEANVTGFYIAPQFNDMFAQYKTAEKLYKESNNEIDKKRAEDVMLFVQKQFNKALKDNAGVKGELDENGNVNMDTISIVGIKTAAAMAEEAQAKANKAIAELNEAEAEQLKIQTAEAINATKDDNGVTNYIPYFAETKDEEGNVSYTVAGYSNKLPTTKEEKNAYIEYLKNDKEQAQNTVWHYIQEFFSDYSTNGKGKTPSEFLKGYYGKLPSEFIEEYLPDVNEVNSYTDPTSGIEMKFIKEDDGWALHFDSSKATGITSGTTIKFKGNDLKNSNWNRDSNEAIIQDGNTSIKVKLVEEIYEATDNGMSKNGHAYQNAITAKKVFNTIKDYQKGSIFQIELPGKNVKTFYVAEPSDGKQISFFQIEDDNPGTAFSEYVSKVSKSYIKV